MLVKGGLGQLGRGRGNTFRDPFLEHASVTHIVAIHMRTQASFATTPTCKEDLPKNMQATKLPLKV